MANEFSKASWGSDDDVGTIAERLRLLLSSDSTFESGKGDDGVGD